MAETASEPDEKAARAKLWIDELATSEGAQRKFLGRAKRVWKRYAADFEETDQKRRYSMLWANTQTIWPAVYARPPEPVVGRRFKDADPVGRAASEILERALSYSIDRHDLDGALRQASLDYTLIARAQTWERYVPHKGEPKTEAVQVTNVAGAYVDDEGREYGEDEVSKAEDGSMTAQATYEPVVFEDAVTDYVHWEDFGFGPARTWEEVPYVWRRVYMDRDQLKERFGPEIGAKVPLDWGEKDAPDEQKDRRNKAAVYEIWCKRSRRVYWINKAYPDGCLDERDDPLRLDGFFPCPRPLFGTLPADSLNPVPDYLQYQDQAEEIDKLTARITELQDALKVRGFYAAAEGEDLNNLMAAGNNVLIPVRNWTTLKEGGGVRGNIEWWPIDQVVAALRECVSQRKELIADVYEITGVSDIMRGSTDPRETAAAQGYKVGFGSLRIRDRQNEMLRFARDVLRIKAGVIAEHFDVETLTAMTGVRLPTAAEKQQLMLMVRQAQAGAPVQLPPNAQDILAAPSWEDVIALLRNNAMRSFRIDVETDSTIQPNENEEQARATQLLQAMGGFFAQIGPVVAAEPRTGPMFAEILKVTVRKFRAGREVEAVIERTLDEISAGPAQGQGGPQEPPPDQTPVQVAQINLQRETVKQQGENQRAMIDAQVSGQEMALRQNEQQLKVVAMNRDPVPQVGV
jgi:hypothetical protein